MQRPAYYFRLYQQTKGPLRTFFWTFIILWLMIVVPTIWTYARLFYARTHIPDPQEAAVPVEPSS